MKQYINMMQPRIEEDNLFHLNRFKYQPPHPSYISGFIDGDGCIFIRKIKYGYQSGISVTQCRTNILQVLMYHFGGSINTTKKRNDKNENLLNEDNTINKYNKRNQYNLLIRSNEYELILNYIKDFIVIKTEQINNLYEINKIINLQNKNEEKEFLYKKCSENNKKTVVNSDNLKKINIEYISGLFDAEGCFYINKNNFNKFYVSITQKNNPIVLEKITEYLNFGFIDSEKKLKIYKKEDCLKFICLVKNNLIVKFNQAIAFEKYLSTNDFNEKNELYKICNIEKHEIEVFSNLNKNDKGKDGYKKMILLRELKEKICKEIKSNKIYEEKSNNMKGKLNHNFGKEKNEETKKKMSNSIRDAKNGISDENILKVRELISQGKKNIEIQEEMNLPRHTVSRIKNNLIVCRNEDKIIKNKISKEQQNINKRKIFINEILYVIDKTNEGLKPMNILDNLIEERNNKNIENTLTIDIVKNVKRNMSQKIMPFYKSEVTQEIYEKYYNLINN